MKLQQTTLILIFLALGLGSFVYFYEIEGAKQQQAAKAKAGQIFSFEEGEIQSFTVTTPQQTLRIERVQNPPKDLPLSQWRIKAPVDAPANDASVSYLLNLLVKGKSDRTFPIAANQLQEYGLDKPQATIDVKLKNQQSHQIVLGKHDYNGNFVYAQADYNKNTQPLYVLLVPVTFEYAVKRPFAEWKATPSPSPTPSNTPVPPSSGGATPSPSPTQSGKPVPPSSGGATPSPSTTQSGKPVPPSSGRATPSASPTPSNKVAPPSSGGTTPSASPTPSNKPVPQNSAQPTPSPAR